MREELFNTAFDENGKDIIQKFKVNFQRLRDFMKTVDKEINDMQIFNQKDDRGVLNANNEIDECKDKYSEITSVQQLKHLLRNYEALVEGQNHLLTQSITKM